MQLPPPPTTHNLQRQACFNLMQSGPRACPMSGFLALKPPWQIWVRESDEGVSRLANPPPPRSLCLCSLGMPSVSQAGWPGGTGLALGFRGIPSLKYLLSRKRPPTSKADSQDRSSTTGSQLLVENCTRWPPSSPPPPTTPTQPSSDTSCLLPSPRGQLLGSFLGSSAQRAPEASPPHSSTHSLSSCLQSTGPLTIPSAQSCRPSGSTSRLRGPRLGLACQGVSGTKARPCPRTSARPLAQYHAILTTPPAAP